MKIDPSKLHSIGRGSVDGLRRAGLDGVRPADGLAGAGGNEGVDQLALSRRAEEVRAARAALAAVPQVRAERVAQLRAQIESGTYRVDPDLLAERILNPRL
ncbi:MAG: flagellar biosynthesis anti-sigma factor FlgM [Armatimonadota bacterium]